MNESTKENSRFRKLVATARELFWKHGMRRVSIEEVCREAGVSKMTFYKFFRNKIALAKYIIDELTDESIERYREIMDQPNPFAEKVRQTIQLKMNSTAELSREFFADLHKNPNSELYRHMEKRMEESIQMVLNDYLAAQKNGDVRPDLKPEFILYFLNKMVDMARDEELAELYASPQALIMELTNFFFYGILTPGERSG